MTAPRISINGSATLHAGDCLAALKTMADASVDSVATDPPYHLTSVVKRFGGQNAAPAQAGTDGLYARQSRGFMGKTWDGGDIAFRVELWAEVFRVLKPGGHVVAFSGTRTYHRMACAIEDAGFEIRDMVSWLYGTGFPKSHDVSKAIDKTGGFSSRDQAKLLRERRLVAGMTRDEVAEKIGCTVASVRDWEEGRSRATGRALEWITPCDVYRSKLADLLGYSADERILVCIVHDRRDDGSVYGIGHSGQIRQGGQTDAARQWEGWGTALKPALEPICLARKPLIGTVAETVLAHGTGALNIDGCRIGSEGGGTICSRRDAEGNCLGHPDRKGAAFGVTFHAAEQVGAVGRWPANVVHDGSDEVLAAFPQTSSGGAPTAGNRNGEVFGEFASRSLTNHGASPGSAARFFYSAKASKADRAGSKHPTVKPVALMRWLVRLVTPPGGVVLDPFAGSGTTGQAAREEGFRSVLIEREAEYLLDIETRLGFAPRAGLSLPDFMSLEDDEPLPDFMSLNDASAHLPSPEDVADLDFLSL